MAGHMGQLLNRDAHRFRDDLSQRYGRVVRILGLFSVRVPISLAIRSKSPWWFCVVETPTTRVRSDCAPHYSDQGTSHIRRTRNAPGVSTW